MRVGSGKSMQPPPPPKPAATGAAPEASAGKAEGTARLRDTGNLLVDLLEQRQREAARRANEKRMIGDQVEADMENGIRPNPGLQAMFAAGTTGTGENILGNNDEERENVGLQATTLSHR